MQLHGHKHEGWGRGGSRPTAAELPSSGITGVANPCSVLQQDLNATLLAAGEGVQPAGWPWHGDTGDSDLSFIALCMGELAAACRLSLPELVMLRCDSGLALPLPPV